MEKENEDGSRSFGLAALVVLAPAVASHQTLERAQLAAHLGWNAGARPYGKIEGWEKIKVQRNADVEGLAVFGDIEADVAKLQTDLRSVFLFGGLIAEPVKMTPTTQRRMRANCLESIIDLAGPCERSVPTANL